MKRRFDCGHRGLGRYCHRCEAARRQALEKAEGTTGRDDDDAWRATFERDPIDLRKLPRSGVLRARDVLQRVAAGESCQSVGGSRWTTDRTVISVRIGWSYRLVFRETVRGMVPMRCMTHEEYNKLRPESLGAR